MDVAQLLSEYPGPEHPGPEHPEEPLEAWSGWVQIRGDGRVSMRVAVADLPLLRDASDAVRAFAVQVLRGGGTRHCQCQLDADRTRALFRALGVSSRDELIARVMEQRLARLPG